MRLKIMHPIITHPSPFWKLKQNHFQAKMWSPLIDDANKMALL